MKVSVDRKEGFKPVTLSITMESMEELCTIFSVFDYITITDFIERYCGEDITENIRSALDPDENIPCEGYHKELSNAITEDNK